MNYSVDWLRTTNGHLRLWFWLKKWRQQSRKHKSWPGFNRFKQWLLTGWWLLSLKFKMLWRFLWWNSWRLDCLKLEVTWWFLGGDSWWLERLKFKSSRPWSWRRKFLYDKMWWPSGQHIISSGLFDCFFLERKVRF